MRVTEMNNSLTESIDVASTVGIVRMLRQSDSQVFSGWGGLPGINDEEVLSVLDAIVNVTAEALKKAKEDEGKSGKILILMSGAGTSGRLAFICARAWNAFVRS
jgi:N-acetylmuramic acid 6-phosphate (MurNAc-6-P) etherase